MRFRLRAPTVVVAVAAIAFGLAAVGVITALHERYAADRGAELSLARAQTAVTALQGAPFRAAAETGGDPDRARAAIAAAKRTVNGTVADLRASSPPDALSHLDPPLRANYEAIAAIYRLGVTVGYRREADELATVAAGSADRIGALLAEAGAEYHRRAIGARDLAIAGTTATIVLLLGVFGLFYTRANRIKRRGEELFDASRREALTDPLTGLGNRRALFNDLETRLPEIGPGRELLVALFDLDGFKQYNDSFGHPAGDALLGRLGGRLADVAAGAGTAYRMGGDEFCLLAEVENGSRELVGRAVEALSESGQAFEIGCSYGTALMPTETDVAVTALQLSDRRMYSDKAARGSAGRQSADVLLKVLDERPEGLREHLNDVAELAGRIGEELGLEEAELDRIQPAAELHDIGKSAIPDAVLNKPGKLDAAEWAFVRRHTLVGERIVLAAPSLAPTASLIRSTHERFDGRGYPDGLRGAEIPLGSRIIAVCDAYAAMTSERSYSEAISSEDAVAELKQCAGREFDADVVRAFCAVADRP